MLFAEVPAPNSEPPPTTAAASTVELVAGTSHTNKVEIMEVMKKLDADLVALFAAEPLLEHQMKKKQELWQQQQQQQQQQHHEKQEQVQQQLEQLQQEEELQKIQVYSKDDTLQLFKQCNALQLHLEALTLQPEGTERMELVQTEIRPIFTVECQLSEELIKLVERYPMFHVMQFESEKFQSLTQCTRFNQMAQREVHFDHLSSSLVDDDDDTKKEDEKMMMMGFGHIDFTVWWREPGTCLNEMLGLGRLQLKELYEASLLEQCKCIPIKRRDNHFASLYLKISLLNNNKNTNSSTTTTTTMVPITNSNSNNNNNVDQKEQTQSNNSNTNSNGNNNNNSSSSSNDDDNNTTSNKSSAPGEYI